ncbi:unnamed protein product [marine sediment metagenome]|uniref:Histidine kinase/HSP90-like ATPase domain-containing protein n=1 Tax=marine sediment metagenome TaxID=412755 RepID=X1RX27_9ZZZZ
MITTIGQRKKELLSGNIALKSEKGKGSTFIVTIPYKATISDTEK